MSRRITAMGTVVDTRERFVDPWAISRPPVTRTPDVGDWIAYRDWGTISLGEVLRLEPGYIAVRNRNEIVHVAYGVGSIVEIRSATAKKPKAKS